MRPSLLLLTTLALSSCWWQTPNQVQKPLASAAASQAQAPGHQHPAQIARPALSTANSAAPPVLVLPELEPVLPAPPDSTPITAVDDPAPHGDHAASGPVSSSGGSPGWFHSGSSGGSSGSQAGSTAPAGSNIPQPQHTMLISEIVLTETGESILGAEAPASIQAHYDQDHEVSITIKGNFQTAPSMSLEHLQFTLEPSVLHLGLVGKEPPVRVTLDHTILLTPVSASATEIVATLNTRGIPELYLKGLHTLTVAAGQLLIERKVQVGEPLSVPASLNPVIDQVEILYDENNKPINLRLHGQHLMLQPKFSYAQVNGEFGFGHQTAVKVATDAEGLESLNWQSIVHLPAPSNFDPDQTHALMYVTPFGATFTTFSGQGE